MELFPEYLYMYLFIRNLDYLGFFFTLTQLKLEINPK